ncbi:winged helix-turn-helix domain-containing protein [Streptomyces sp. NBC_00316]|uniref:winged helix-turn-helix domain-containing protein n=1 Tax=Streptomyces sp. NBC_00316 TaxID=2975710 RepID=UPI003FA79531
MTLSAGRGVRAEFRLSRPGRPFRSGRRTLIRKGWSCQAPARRAVERDDEAVAGWFKEVWPCADGQRRPVEPGGLRGQGRLSHDAAAGQDRLRGGCLAETGLTVSPRTAAPTPRITPQQPFRQGAGRTPPGAVDSHAAADASDRPSRAGWLSRASHATGVLVQDGP